jgi:hypothetical protein
MARKGKGSNPALKGNKNAAGPHRGGNNKLSAAQLKHQQEGQRHLSAFYEGNISYGNKDITGVGTAAYKAGLFGSAVRFQTFNEVKGIPHISKAIQSKVFAMHLTPITKKNRKEVLG